MAVLGYLLIALVGIVCVRGDDAGPTGDELAIRPLRVDADDRTVVS